MQTRQHRTTARLVRRALEAALPLPSNSRNVADRVLHVLPLPRDGTLRETKAEQVMGNGGRRRIRTFKPYEDLFAFRRVVTPPWDEVWKRTPLVLHDVELLEVQLLSAFPPFAPYYDHVESISKILEYHPGPVQSLRVDSSLFPRPEVLGRWMDSLSTRSVTELVMLDVARPRDVAAVEFPIHRLRASALSTLALVFVKITLGRCSGFSELEALFLVGCQCTARDVSVAVENLPNLKRLWILGVDLTAAGAGAGCGDLALDIASDSLTSMDLMGCQAWAVTVRHAPCLQSLLAGVVPPNLKKPRVLWLNMENAAIPPVRIKVHHAEVLNSMGNLRLWQHSVHFFSAGNVGALEVSLQMGRSEQWRQLLNLASQLPLLRCLELTVSPVV